MTIVDQKLLANCPITTQDIRNAETIFGPDIGSLKGKTVRRGPLRVEGFNETIPADIMDRYQSQSFLRAISCTSTKSRSLCRFLRYIKFSTAEVLQSRSTKVIMAAIKQIQRTYRHRGLRLNTLLMDGEFEHLRGHLAALQITLSTLSHGMSMFLEIERYIRTVKERTRCVYNTLPLCPVYPAG